MVGASVLASRETQPREADLPWYASPAPHLHHPPSEVDAKFSTRSRFTQWSHRSHRSRDGALRLPAGRRPTSAVVCRLLQTISER